MLRDSLIVYDDGTPKTKHVTKLEALLGHRLDCASRGPVDLLRRLTPPRFVAGVTLIWRLSGGRWWPALERSRVRAVVVAQCWRRGR